MTLPAHKERRNGWERVKVGRALRLINGRAFKPSEWKTSGLPIIRIQNLNDPDALFNYYEGGLPEKFLVHEGELLFAWSGTPGTSFGAHIWRGGKAWLNQHIFKVLFDETEFDKRFLQLAINENLDEYIRAAHGAAGLAHITKGRFEESEIPKPDLDEQREIVAEIEKQFTRLEAGVAGLLRVQANLKRYRAAVLKAACEGKLVPTEAELSHQEGRTYETGAQLLERILTERRQKWNGKGKYKEPVKPDTANLPTLPDGWAWASLESITNALGGYAFQSKKFCDSGFQVLKMGNVRMGRIDLSQRLSFIAEVDQDVVDKYQLLDGDVVITLTGSRKKEDYGYVALVKDAASLLLNQRIARLRSTGGILPAFLQLVMQSKDFRKRFFSYETGNVGQGNVGMTAITKESIPVAPIAEQKRIVAEVERRLSLVEGLEAVSTANLQRSTRLRQSILGRAFSGRSWLL